MAKVRQDAWSHEDDLLLAETVLRHVRDGSTQLNAFEEVGDELNRTSAACGFRWNAEVRKNYVQAMEMAKRQRKENKRALQAAQKQQHTRVQPKPSTHMYRPSNAQADDLPEESITLDQVIHQLQQLRVQEQQYAHSTYELQQVERENASLKDRVEELEKQVKQTERQYTMMKEDYESFVQIMERARKMTVFEDEQNMKAPAFKMDKNGNLEQLVERLN